MKSKFEYQGEAFATKAKVGIRKPLRTATELLSALGVFDMDPCASQHQPWRTAETQFTIERLMTT